MAQRREGGCKTCPASWETMSLNRVDTVRRRAREPLTPTLSASTPQKREEKKHHSPAHTTLPPSLKAAAAICSLLSVSHPHNNPPFITHPPLPRKPLTPTPSSPPPAPPKPPPRPPSAPPLPTPHPAPPAPSSHTSPPHSSARAALAPPRRTGGDLGVSVSSARPRDRQTDGWGRSGMHIRGVGDERFGTSRPCRLS